MIRRKNSKFYNAAIQLSFGCLVELNNDGVVVNFENYINQIPETAGRGFLDHKWSDIFIPVDERYKEFDLSALFGEGGDRANKILTIYDEKLYIEWKFLQVSDSRSDQDFSGILGAGIDVTGHIELKQQLQHADRLATVGQLAAGIAHEINGPLNDILGYAQLSAKQQDLPEQVYNDLDNIVRLSLHAGEVVKKVMLFSRQVKPKHDLVDLNEVIRESLYFVEPLCRQNKIDVECRLEKSLPPVIGDFSQLRQVVVNLMVNAAQAITGNKGRIRVSTSSESGDCVNLSIKDTGIGMSSETLEQCFMPFFTTKDVDQGTGLGLAVVHGIIKSHNSTISAESILGEGSCFRIFFPLDTDKGVQND